ncbi:hypothetical protein CTT31_02595 [Pseudoalteromonas maricaloris]|uniref:hypothetical protein n=1 Tax=Pseudoalteromonas maricaloris TaxID=184924 RepID=UPI0021AD78CD|nr:hypothetical protein [Pseudoalteromonas flavipulchra]USE68070.1 hypothetical protein CTT31_02595 [Pseudoalteromonas flavipulchra]
MIKLLSKIKNLCNKLLSKGVYYFDGELKAIDFNKKQLCVVEQKEITPLVVIVSSDHYKTELRTVPFTTDADVRRALKLKRNTGQFWTVGKKLSQKTEVNYWRFSDAVPKGVFTVPEALFYLCANKLRFLEVEGHRSSYYMSFSEGSFQVTRKFGLINSAEKFLLSIGEPQHFSQQFKSADNSLLINSLTNLASFNSLRLCLSFFNSQAAGIDKIKLTNSVILPLSLVLLIYLSASSLYLIGKELYVTSKYQSIESSAFSLIENQNKFDETKTKLDAINRLVSQDANYPAALYVMTNVFNKVKMSNLLFESGRFVFRAEAEKATDILAIVKEHPSVRDAKFDLPVVQSRANERFTISFTLSNTHVIEKVNK